MSATRFSSIDQLEILLKRYPDTTSVLDIEGLILDYLGQSGSAIYKIFELNPAIYRELFAGSDKSAARRLLKYHAISRSARARLREEYSATKNWGIVVELLAEIDPSGGDLVEWAGGDRAGLAIVFTDVIEGTELQRRVGEEAMRVIMRAHLSQARTIAANHHGRIVKIVGDEIIALFHSVDHALDFSLEFHKSPGDERLRIRVGIHTGEIQVEPDDLNGMHVNLTARILGVNRGSEIWISGDAKRALDALRAQRHEAINWQQRHDVTLKDFPGTSVFALVAADHARSHL